MVDEMSPRLRLLNMWWLLIAFGLLLLVVVRIVEVVGPGRQGQEGW